MNIAIASDHAGFELKQAIGDVLCGEGHVVNDFGTDSDESVDYADFAEPAARAVAGGEADRAVLVCGSGVGVAIVANKVDGVRAVNAHDAEEAALSRRHNDANVLTLSGRNLALAEATAIIKSFFETAFEGGRHERRVEKITAVESRGEASGQLA